MPSTNFEVVDFPRRPGEQPRSVADTNAELDRIFDERRWDDASFFYMNILLQVLPVNAHTIETMMEVSENVGRPAETINIFHEPRTSYVKRTPRMYGKLMRAHQLRGNVDKMHNVFREMVEKGIPRAIECYNSLLYEDQAENNLNAAIETEKMIHREGLAFNSVTYDRLLAIFYKNKRTEDVDRLLDDITAKKAKVGTLGLSLLSKRALSKDDLEATNVFRRTIAKQREVPHHVFFDSLIEWYISKNKIPQALKTLREMREYNHVPSSDSMRFFVKYHAEREETENATQFVMELKAGKQKPDLDIYTTILDMLYRAKSVHDYRVYITEMMDSNIVPLRRSWNLYLELVSKYLEDSQEIEDAFDWPKQRGETITGEEYKLLVRAYCRLGRPDMALHLRDNEMKDQKFEFDASDYSAVIHSAAQKSPDDALQLVAEMRQKSFSPDVPVFLVAIAARAKLLHHDEARTLWRELSGLLPGQTLSGDDAIQIMQSFASLGDGEGIESVFSAVCTHFPKTVGMELFEAYFSQIAFTRDTDFIMKAYSELKKPSNPLILPIDASNTIYLYLLKHAQSRGADGLAVASRLLSDALVSKYSSPLYSRVALTFLVHVLQFGNDDAFEPAADLLRRVHALGFAYLNQELANAFKKALTTHFSAANLLPAKNQLPRDMSMLHNFTALREGRM